MHDGRTDGRAGDLPARAGFSTLTCWLGWFTGCWCCCSEYIYDVYTGMHIVVNAKRRWIRVGRTSRTPAGRQKAPQKGEGAQRTADPPSRCCGAGSNNSDGNSKAAAAGLNSDRRCGAADDDTRRRAAPQATATTTTTTTAAAAVAAISIAAVARREAAHRMDGWRQASHESL